MKHKLHKLMAMFIASIFAVSAFAADIDVTSKVSTSKDAWKGNNGGPVNIDGIALPEKYETTTATLGDVMWQTVEGLENGTYTVELWANARYTSGRGFESQAADGAEGFTYLYANNVEISIAVYHNGDLNNGKSYKLEGVEVTDGTLKMGMTKKGAGSNWHTIQIKSLIYHASDAEALAAAKIDLQAALDAANAVSPASDEFTAAIAAAQNIYDNSQDVEEVKATTESLVKATKDAILANASLDNPVLTDFVVNGTFDTAIAPWKSTTGAQNQALASNQQGAFTGNFFENWNGSNYTGKLYQVIEGIPNGLYELSICAFVETFDASAQFVYANSDKVALVAGAPTAYTVRTKVTDNTIEVGFEQTAAVNRWCGIDNVSLTYLGNADALSLYNKTKAQAEALLTEKMAPEALEALKAAILKEVDTTSDEAIAAAEAEILAAMGVANASINLFATNKVAIDAMFALMESTNVYTAEAFLAYKSIADDYLAQYEAGTLTATVDNPAAVHGWHAEVAYDDMLLSAFGTNNFDTNLYINTWSTEGGSDGSNFTVPFFEYWVGDGESLGATTKTATVTGLVPGAAYTVEAWVRTRAKNGVAAADATGITLSVGDGVAVDVTEGTVIGESQFAHAVYTATGNADAEGNLTINFNVVAENNISWLSFKNLKYTAIVEEEPAAPKYYTIASYNRGGVLTDVNGAAHHVAVNENSYWYFVEANDNGGVNICNVNGRSLNHDLTIGETETPAVWYILPNGVNELGQSISKTNPISNSSCIDANNHNTGVGTWAPSASDWEGTTWVIVEVDYLKDIEALIEANKDNHAKKPALGQYTTAAYEALVAAKETVKDPIDAIKAVKAFESTKNLPMFTIDSQKDYALGQSIYENEEGGLKFKTVDATDLSMLWAFDMTATEVGLTDKVVVRNVATGNLFWGASFIAVIETEPAVEGDGVFMFKTEGTGSPVHAQQNGSAIVRWSSADANCVGGASTWKFTYVGDTYSLMDLEPEELSIVSATAGDVAIVEGKATVESISSFEITFNRPVALAEDAEWAQLTDQWGDNPLKAEVLADNNCVVRFALQWEQVFTDAGDYYLYIPEGVVVDAENANCVNAAIEAVITIEGGNVTPGASLNVTNVTVGEDVMADLSAISATPADMIKINFDGKFYFQGQPSIVDENGDDASMAFEFMNGLDFDGSDSYILMGKEAGVYTITLAKDQFNELAMMGWKAPAEDIVLKVQIIVENDPTGIESVESQNEAVIYDLSGRRVQTMTKGLYIVNGRKVVVK